MKEPAEKRPLTDYLPMPHAPTDLIAPLARLGYAAKGIVYGIVGVLAVQAATRAGGGAEGTRGAISAIGAQPFGQVLLGLTALGLLGYVVWRFTAAAYDPDHDDDDGALSYLRRIGFAVSGFTYLGLALFAGRRALGSGTSSSSNGSESWAQTLLQQPLGRWLVAAVGLVVIGVGLYQFYRAYKASFMEHYRAGALSTTQRTWAERLGRFGLSARGVTFGLIGFFFLQAAWQSDSDEAGGLAEAFDTLAAQRYGPYLLGIVALGFVAYGVYCLSRARYRTFNVK